MSGSHLRPAGSFIPFDLVNLSKFLNLKSHVSIAKFFNVPTKLLYNLPSGYTLNAVDEKRTRISFLVSSFHREFKFGF